MRTKLNIDLLASMSLQKFRHSALIMTVSYITRSGSRLESSSYVPHVESQATQRCRSVTSPRTQDRTKEPGTT